MTRLEGIKIGMLILSAQENYHENNKFLTSIITRFNRGVKLTENQIDALEEIWVISKSINWDNYE